jgi:hypothetical protein
MEYVSQITMGGICTNDYCHILDRVLFPTSTIGVISAFDEIDGFNNCQFPLIHTDPERVEQQRVEIMKRCVVGSGLADGTSSMFFDRG